MTTVDALASLQQLRATFAGLTGSSNATSGDQTTSSTDFDSLIAALTTASSSSTTTAASDATSDSDSTSAATAVSTAATSAATGVTGSLVSDGPVTGADVVKDAEKYLGVPYVFGGESTSGMDCSGLVQKTFKDLGVSLTRGVSTQKLQGQAVDGLANAQPGDLIVFKGGGHIGIYAGNDEVIHAPYPGRTVSLQKLWVGDSGIETIRRIVPSTSGSATVSSSAATDATSSATATATAASAASSATSSTSASTEPTLAQAQAALLAAQQAMMQADLAMMSGSSDASSTDSITSSSDPLSALTSADSTGSSSTDSTSGTATSGSTADAIQQFIASQEALMTQGAS